MKTFNQIRSLIKKVYPKLSTWDVLVRAVYFSFFCSVSQRSTAVRYLTSVADGYYVMVVTSLRQKLSEEETAERILSVGTCTPNYKFGAPVTAMGHKKCNHEMFHYIMEPDARFLVKDTSVDTQEGTLVACRKNIVIDLSTGSVIPAERTFS